VEEVTVVEETSVVEVSGEETTDVEVSGEELAVEDVSAEESQEKTPEQ
jgi:hypothetical protein